MAARISSNSTSQHVPLAQALRGRRQASGSDAQSFDGFVIAKADLPIRDPGDLLGTRQAGMPEVEVAEILLKQARKEAFALCSAMRSAPGDKQLRGELMLRWGGRLGLATIG